MVKGPEQKKLPHEPLPPAVRIADVEPGFVVTVQRMVTSIERTADGYVLHLDDKTATAPLKADDAISAIKAAPEAPE